MKIAILFSGRLTGYKDNYELIMKNIVSNNEVDFFIAHEKNVDSKILNDFVNLYKPKIILESDENYFDISKYNYKSSGNKHNLMCMFLNRYKVFTEFEKYCDEMNKEYDLIISHRLDLAFEEKIDLNKFYDKIKEDFLFIPSGNDYGGINDQFAFGNIDVMFIYMNCYNGLKELFEKKINIHPETLLNEYLKNNELTNIERFEVKNNLIREKKDISEKFSNKKEDINNINKYKYQNILFIILLVLFIFIIFNKIQKKRK